MTHIQKILLAPAAFAALALGACTDDAGDIGGSLTRGEVSIEIDSTFQISGKAVADPVFDSKGRTLLLGSLDVPEYGKLDCSFVSQLMPSSDIEIPDTVPAEQITGLTMRMMMLNGDFTGDSLAPQQVTLYRLTRQLPSDITSDYDPEGGYDPTPLSQKAYTASALGLNDSVFNRSYRVIDLKLPLSSAKDVYTAYRTNPEAFQWPAELAKRFPGIYARNSYGKGLVVNIANTEFLLKYNIKSKRSKYENGEVTFVDTLIPDSTTIFTISPEVLSSNNMKFTPAAALKARAEAGEPIILGPGGYNVEFRFPAQEIINRYSNSIKNLSVVNSLTCNIPIKDISNDYGIRPPRYMLMIKSARMKEFFANNEVPEGYVGEETDTDAFWAEYDADTQSYDFTALRPYLLDLLEKGSVAAEDEAFTLVPVSITKEYWGSSYNVKTFVSACFPYYAGPCMGLINFDKAKIKFTFSRQVLE